ncbi:hypothetical protein O4H52_02275 [Sphingomonadaceae bacterium G21617-S1]|nr:hypothetical protein [Sphingomonadaceae bacterium G21617-S1]
MDHIFDQIKGTLEAGFPYAAIMLALSVPDICASLALPANANDGAQKKRYLRWYRENVLPRFDVLSDEDVWSLRCGVVHEGAFGNKDKTFDRVIFCGDGHQGIMSVHDSTINGVHYDRLLIIGATLFCEKIIESAFSWFEKNRGSPNVKANLWKLVGTYSEGIPPLIGGVTCVG